MEIEMKLNGRERIEGKDADAIVERMSQMQWPAEKPTQYPAPIDYMHAVSDRLKIQGGAGVRTCCADHFLDDLAAARVIKRLS